MKSRKHLQRLIGITTLLAASSMGVAGATSFDYLGMFENGYQADGLTIAREGDRVPNYHWGVFEIQPAVVPAATDSKGGMAPSVADERWEAFASVFWFTQKTDQQTSLDIPEINTDIWGLDAGARYRINNAWSVGGMVGYGDAFMQMKAFDFEFAKVRAESWNFTPFVSYEQKNLIAGADFEAQLQYTYGSNQYRDNLLYVTSNSSGNSNTIDLTTGLVWTSGDLHHGPVVGVRYIDAHENSFSNDGLPFPKATDDSFASILGYQASYDIKLGCGKIIPALYANWEHEYRTNVNSLVAGVPNSTIDKDVAVLGVGVGFYANCGWNTVLDYEARLNSATNSSFVGLKIGNSF